MPDNFNASRWAVPLVVARSPEPPLIELVVAEAKAKPRGLFIVHPRYRTWLEKCGVTSADTALSLNGDIVSGHADRHVVRVELFSGSATRGVFLKREHRVKWRTRLRNRFAGYGRVSLAEREAMTLARLEAAGLPAPQWLAYGEDHSGKAFLLLDALPGAMSLPAYLEEFTLTQQDRRMLCEKIGRMIAEFHNAGFGTPELAAKHILIQPASLGVSLIDWQSTPRHKCVTVSDVAKWFGKLASTLPGDAVSDAERLRLIWAYRRTRHFASRDRTRPKLSAFVGLAARSTKHRRQRTSDALQRRPQDSDTQRLVWLADEAVVAIPEMAALWPTPAVCEPFYLKTTPTGTRMTIEPICCPDDRFAQLVRFHTANACARILAKARERSWRSPSAIAARILFHLEKFNIPAPKLLAFGQKITSWNRADSFLLYELSNGEQDIRTVLSLTATRTKLLKQMGHLLWSLHEARLRPNWPATDAAPLLVVRPEVPDRVRVGSPLALRLCPPLTLAQREQDLKQLCLFTSAWDEHHLRCAYQQSGSKS